MRLLVPVVSDAGDVGFYRVREQILGRARDDLPREAGLDAMLREELDGVTGARVTVRLSELFDRLVRYRNREIGHGAAGQRNVEVYERMGRSILLGVAEVLGRVDVLAGRRLVYISDVRRQPTGAWLVDRDELLGESRRRLDPIVRAESEVGQLPRPGLVYLETDSTATPVQPLLVYDPDGDEVLFLNSRRGRLRTEYLGYSTGRVMERPDLAGAQQELLARVLAIPVDPGQVERWTTESQAEEGPAVVPAMLTRRRIGEFELLSRLGQGGMGVVYRAWQPSVGRQVALKCLLRSNEPKAEARFAREIRALGRVEHPNLVKIFTSGSEGDQWFYAMELVEGTTLASVSGALATRSPKPAALDLSAWQAAVETACDETRRAETPLSDEPMDASYTSVPAFPVSRTARSTAVISNKSPN